MVLGGLLLTGCSGDADTEADKVDLCRYGLPAMVLAEALVKADPIDPAAINRFILSGDFQSMIDSIDLAARADPDNRYAILASVFRINSRIFSQIYAWSEGEKFGAPYPSLDIGDLQQDWEPSKWVESECHFWFPDGTPR